MEVLPNKGTGPLEAVDVPALVEVCTDPWYNQSLCRRKRLREGAGVQRPATDGRQGPATAEQGMKLTIPGVRTDLLERARRLEWTMACRSSSR